jgi:hypothetical protein
VEGSSHDFSEGSTQNVNVVIKGTWERWREKSVYGQQSNPRPHEYEAGVLSTHAVPQFRQLVTGFSPWRSRFATRQTMLDLW